MAAKYHINPETGKPGLCTASIQECRYAANGEMPQHYDTIEKAKEAYERANKQQIVPKIIKQRKPKPVFLTKFLQYGASQGKLNEMSQILEIENNELVAKELKLFEKESEQKLDEEEISELRNEIRLLTVEMNLKQLNMNQLKVRNYEIAEEDYMDLSVENGKLEINVIKLADEIEQDSSIKREDKKEVLKGIVELNDNLPYRMDLRETVKVYFGENENTIGSHVNNAILLKTVIRDYEANSEHSFKNREHKALHDFDYSSAIYDSKDPMKELISKNKYADEIALKAGKVANPNFYRISLFNKAKHEYIRNERIHGPELNTPIRNAHLQYQICYHLDEWNFMHEGGKDHPVPEKIKNPVKGMFKSQQKYEEEKEAYEKNEHKRDVALKHNKSNEKEMLNELEQVRDTLEDIKNDPYTSAADYEKIKDNLREYNSYFYYEVMATQGML